MKKRTLSLLLALVLALSLVPTASAYEGQTSQIDRAPEQQDVVLTESAPTVTGWEEPVPYPEETTATYTRSLYGAVIDEQQVYQTINSFRSKYPEGMYWTNESQQYTLSVPILGKVDGQEEEIFSYFRGYGCAAFCFLLSDAAFGTGSLNAYKIYDFTYDDVHVGDILRVNDDQHSVTVLKKYSDHVVLAEANYNSRVHWDRTMTRAEVMRADYLTTRYPAALTSLNVSVSRSSVLPGEKVNAYICSPIPATYNLKIWKGAKDSGEPEWEGYNISPTTTYSFTRYSMGVYTVYMEAVSGSGQLVSGTATFTVSDGKPFKDVPATAYYAVAVEWAYSNGIAAGTSTTTFSPDDTVTRGQAVAFLWRAMGKHTPSASQSRFTDVSTSDYYFQAVQWAAENGIAYGVSATEFDPNGAVKRSEMITFLWRAMGRPGETGQGEWYADAESWARSYSLLTGTAAAYATGAACPRSDVVYYMWKALS